MDNKPFAVGDKVIRNNYNIGVVTKISEKRGFITVQFDNFTERYNRSGWTTGDIWTSSHIVPWTQEAEDEIKEKKMIRNCKEILSDLSQTSLSADNARKILDFLTREGLISEKTVVGRKNETEYRINC